MLTITEAFRKFRTKLELTQKEQDDASRRQQDIRAFMDECFHIERDFLTGSYKRWTKTKPLKDVDIFCVLGEDERKYRSEPPSVLLAAIDKKLAKEYGRNNVGLQRRSVSVNFGVAGEEERVMSFDVVPAFDKGHHYEIPDTQTKSGWTETDPEIHAEKATAANDAFSGEWKGLVRMIKRWNNENGKSVKPSFFLEVMALDFLRPPFRGDYPYEFMAFFASAAERIHQEWTEPARLGPPVSDGMTTAEKHSAKARLLAASNSIRTAINLSNRGQNGEALREYRKLFGELFPLS
jgi:Second Messenger Oligonucleotide or Dinucleotide Synthetase domain